MVRAVIVRKNQYYDSVFLMQGARRIAGQPGIRDASAVLGTDANRKLLAEAGYGGPDLEGAGPNDLLIAIHGEDTPVAAVTSDPDAWLTGTGDGPGATGSTPDEPRTIAEAVALRPDSSVAVISVPGEHAAREARAALREGLNVFLFSSNVSVEDELSLKTEARRKGLIVMGPDCGTAFLGGAGIGFANAVRRGPIGIIGSTGTGMQELSSLIHQAGSGVSHGIGTGSRDLSDAIGGISTMMAIDALEEDPGTGVLTILSKPPGEATAARLLSRLRGCAKPVVVCLLGAEGAAGPAAGASAATVRVANTIDETAALALEAVGSPGPSVRSTGSVRELAATQVARMRPSQRFVRGLFAGGTFCYQAQAVFRKAGLVVHSNAPITGMIVLEDPRRSRQDALVDMGAEVFVEGRPHPMIDATLRRKRVAQEGEDPSVAVLLLDFILGAISSRDPVGDLLPSVRDAMDGARRRGDHLCVVASVCGTDEDAQGLPAQRDALAEAGVLVFPSSARAAAFCREVALLLAQRKEGR